MPGTAAGDPWPCGVSVVGCVGARGAAPLRSGGGGEGSPLFECGAGQDGTVPAPARRLCNARAAGRVIAASRGSGTGLLPGRAGALWLPGALAGVAGRGPPLAERGSLGGVSGAAGPGTAGRVPGAAGTARGSRGRGRGGGRGFVYMSPHPSLKGPLGG